MAGHQDWWKRALNEEDVAQKLRATGGSFAGLYHAGHPAFWNPVSDFNVKRHLREQTMATGKNQFKEARRGRCISR